MTSRNPHPHLQEDAIQVPRNLEVPHLLVSSLIQNSLFEVGLPTAGLIATTPGLCTTSEGNHRLELTSILNSERATPTTPFSMPPHLAEAINVSLSSRTPSPVHHSMNLDTHTLAAPHSDSLGSSTQSSLPSSPPEVAPPWLANLIARYESQTVIYLETITTLQGKIEILSDDVKTTNVRFERLSNQLDSERAEWKEKHDHLEKNNTALTHEVTSLKESVVSLGDIVSSLTAESVASRNDHNITKGVLMSLQQWAFSDVILHLFSGTDRQLIACLQLQDNNVLTAIQGRIMSDEIMKFLSWILELPGLSPDLWNGSRIFRQWLDSETTAAMQEMKTTQNPAPIDEDSLRKAILKDNLWPFISKTSGKRFGSTPNDLPYKEAVSLLYDSSEALDALTIKKYIVREEGNYGAHNLISFQRFSSQMKGHNSYMDVEPTTAMQVFINVFSHINKSIPQIPPPAGSTIWSTAATPGPDPTSAPATTTPTGQDLTSAPASATPTGPNLTSATPSAYATASPSVLGPAPASVPVPSPVSASTALRVSGAPAVSIARGRRGAPAISTARGRGTPSPSARPGGPSSSAHRGARSSSAHPRGSHSRSDRGKQL